MSDYKSPFELTPKGVLDKRIAELRAKRHWRNQVVPILVTFLFLFVLFNIVIGWGTVSGSSMQPALFKGDAIVFWRLSGEYTHGDIVLIKPDERLKEYTKRIVGVPGDTVDIDDSAGTVILNGQRLSETFIFGKTNSKTAEGVTFPIRLSENEYFVLGDNRGNSTDSRNFGAVEASRIDGKVILVLHSPE